MMAFTPSLARKIFFSGLILIGVGLLLRPYFKTSDHWQYYLEQNLGTSARYRFFDEVIFDEQNIYFNSENHNTYSLDQKTGRTNWIFSAQGQSPFPPTLAKDCLATANFDGFVYCLDPQTGQEKWHYEIPNQTLPDLPVVASTDQELLFVGSRKGNLAALKRESGEVVWQQSFPAIDSTSYTNAPIHFGMIWAHQDQLYVVHGPSESLLSLDPQTGQEKWQAKNFKFTYQKPYFKKDFVFFKQNGFVTSVNLQNGASKTLALTDTQLWEASILDPDPTSDTIVISEKTQLSGWSLDFKEKKWQKSAVTIDFSFSDQQQATTLIGQTFNIQKNITSVSVLDPQTGESLHTLDKNLSPFTRAWQSQSLLILANFTGHVIGLDPNDLTELFSFKLDHKILAIKSVADGFVIVTEKPSHFLGFALIDQTGQIVWQYVPDFPTNNDNLYFQQNNVYFTNSDEEILEKFTATASRPPQNKTKKYLNFTFKQATANWLPYLEIQVKSDWQTNLKTKLLRFQFALTHIKKLFTFKFDLTQDGSIHQLKIQHDDLAYQNPQLDVKIEARFTHLDSNQTTTVRGYYANRDLWQINFLPKTVGQYRAKVTITTPFAVKRHQFELDVTQTDYNPLSIKNQNFVDTEGKIFLPLGIEDTFFDLDFDGDRLNQIPASDAPRPVTDKSQYGYQHFDEHLKKFFPEAGINFYRYGVENVTPPQLYQFTDHQQFVPYLQGGKFADHLVGSLRQNQIRIMMTIFGFFPPYDSAFEITQPNKQKLVKQYLDYIVARYSAYVDLWEISNEAYSDQEYYKQTTAYLRQIDPYHHPISTNWEEPSNPNFDYVSIHNYETPTTSLSTLVNSFYNLSLTSATQPTVISELGLKKFSWYEGSLLQARIMAWLSTFHNLGIVFWNQGQNDIYYNEDNANLYLGPQERLALKSLQDFLPEFTEPLQLTNYQIEGTDLRAFIMRDQNYFAAYLINTSHDAQAYREYFILPLPKDSLVEIVDPKTNTTLESFTTTSDQQNIHLPAFIQDLAIKAQLPASVL